MLKKISYILFLISILSFPSLTGCGLLKRSRITQLNGIARNDFDLPIFIYPSPDSSSNALAIVLSGDGGWAEFEDEISMQFAAAGLNTIGFNSRDYFWEQKTPRQTADDMALLIRKYARKYKPKKILLCGYSFGADVVPFIYNRLHQHLKNRITALALLSPFATTAFKVHTSDLLNIAKDNKKFNVKAEVDKVKIPIFCFYGQQEDPKPLEGIVKANFFLNTLPGGHSYNNIGYKDMISILKKALE